MEYRHLMSCDDCWAYYLDEDRRKHCRIDQEGLNRPIEIPVGKVRLQISGSFQRNLLEKWACDYRYTKNEVALIQLGKLKDIRVTPEDAVKLLEMTAT